MLVDTGCFVLGWSGSAPENRKHPVSLRSSWLGLLIAVLVEPEQGSEEANEGEEDWHFAGKGSEAEYSDKEFDDGFEGF